MNRYSNGDYYKKPTQYFFVNCKPQNNLLFEPVEVKELKKKVEQKTVNRSMISKEYENRFIREFILEKDNENNFIKKS